MALLDPIFLPLFKFNLLLGLVVISFIVTLFSTLIYKYTTDQLLMKRIKREIKELQEKAKAAAEDPQKVMEINKEMFSKSMEQMKSNFKSSMYTMIPVMVILLYLSSSFSFAPISPNQEFEIEVTTNQDIEINLENPDLTLNKIEKYKLEDTYLTSYFFVGDKQGDYTVSFNNNTQTIKLTNEYGFIEPVQQVNKEIVKIETKHDKLVFLNLFGWRLGWFGAYIIISILFSMIIRKLLNVH